MPAPSIFSADWRNELLKWLTAAFQPLAANLTSWASVTRASGFDAFAATPSSANLKTLLTDEVGSGLAMFGEQGTWTPVLTFATPGNLAVTYTTQAGTWTRKGQEISLNFNIVTASFTHTTASGGLQITGSPFTNSATGARFGSLSWAGITKAGYTQVNCRIGPSISVINFQASGSGAAVSAVMVADTPTGGTMTLQGTLVFEV